VHALSGGLIENRVFPKTVIIRISKRNQGHGLNTYRSFEEVLQFEGGGYTAYMEEFPGTISEGDTLEEARDNLRDAIKVLVEVNREVARKPTLDHTVVREPITILLCELAKDLLLKVGVLSILFQVL
jgi:predicted RNase H-like HicB family nuclease